MMRPMEFRATAMRTQRRDGVGAAPAPAGAAEPPLVAHLIYRLDVGGLENGLVNLINRMPPHRYRHVIICLTSHTDFRRRIDRPDVAIHALDKPAGNSPRTLYRLWRLLRRLQPSILHTRNLAALEGAVPALLAGVGTRIHGEHGRDIDDIDGSNVRQQRIRRLFRPFVGQYVALSKDLEGYLRDKIHVPRAKIAQLYNGVDTDLFHPAAGGRGRLPLQGFATDDTFVIGTIGRMQPVKDQLTLARAFVLLLQIVPRDAPRLRLVMIGDGPLRAEVAAILEEADALPFAWLPGERSDIPQLMRALDLFVLPSLGEGISNTILEAMATGLPVVATAVGGSPELVADGRTGTLVSRADPQAMALAMLRYVADPALCRRQGDEARRVAERYFGLTAMVERYMTLYDTLLAKRT